MAMAVGNYGAALWLLAFAVIISLALWGDHEFRTTENLIGRLGQYRAVVKEPAKYPKATLKGQHGSTYLWQVEAVGQYGATIGPPWYFRTIDEPR